jgi:MOSC domain-containing protein YiiM
MTDAAIRHLSTEELEAGVDHIRQAPKDQGVLQLLVRRPVTLERELLQEGKLDTELGLVGDNWQTRGSGSGAANPDAQITVMNARAAALIAQDDSRWQLAGDQLYVDMDLSEDNVPAGTRLSVGSAVLEVTAEPHNGCKKFVERFGMDAMLFVNSEVGKQLHLRGINTKVVQAGTVCVGDAITKTTA